jgi:hypothetical protein
MALDMGTEEVMSTYKRRSGAIIAAEVLQIAESRSGTAAIKPPIRAKFSPKTARRIHHLGWLNGPRRGYRSRICKTSVAASVGSPTEVQARSEAPPPHAVGLAYRLEQSKGPIWDPAAPCFEHTHGTGTRAPRRMLLPCVGSSPDAPTRGLLDRSGHVHLG